MKRSILFILILTLSNFKSLTACGYYPYGEEVRFQLLNPHYFYYDDFSPFYYSSELFKPKAYELPLNYRKEGINSLTKANINLWRKRYHDIPSEKDVYETIYLMKNDFYLLNDSVSKIGDPNKFIQLMIDNKDVEAIKYLKFAKKCEQMNTMISDPWERNDYASLPQRTTCINEALVKARTLKDIDLKHRYAFQAIRLSYYNEKLEDISKIYDEFFGEKAPANIIDYWSLYFKALSEKDSVEKNYHLSIVFANAPDKRFMTSQFYDKSIPIDQALKYAKTNKDKADVWLLAGIKNPARAYESIKNIYILEPQSEGLSFLLLREINKLEDWIYTPYYTYFDPSVSDDEDEWHSTKINNLERVKNDRIYAKKLLDFTLTVNLGSVENTLLWKTAKSYLYLMTESYNSSIVEINTLQSGIKNKDALFYQLEMIKALCQIAQQEEGKAVITESTKAILMRQYDSLNYKFIFAVAREFEFKGNTTDAALLLSKIGTNETHPEYVFGREFDATILWKTKKGYNTLRDDYFYEFFYYMDAQYTPEQTKSVIDDVIGNQKKDAFNNWKYKNIKNQLDRLYDLLGTKYMRKNDFEKAFDCFQKVPNSYWLSKDNPYHVYLAANPFYTNMYNEHVVTKADTTHLTKSTIVKTLMNYLKKAEDITNKDRDLYYFLVANCYLNMTQYGNSWMMKRYYWSSSEFKTNLEDDDEYFQCNLAKEFYLKAKEVSKCKKFAALCLRMAGRCEKYRLMSTDPIDRWNYKGDEFETKVFEKNIYYNQIKKEYPSYYKELISNCESFNSYFIARK